MKKTLFGKNKNGRNYLLYKMITNSKFPTKTSQLSFTRNPGNMYNRIALDDYPKDLEKVLLEELKQNCDFFKTK